MNIPKNWETVAVNVNSRIPNRRPYYIQSLVKPTCTFITAHIPTLILRSQFQFLAR